MSRIAFTDESCTHAATPCYGIGAVSIRRERLSDFDAHFTRLKTKYRIEGEFKWNSIGNRFSNVNMILDLLNDIYRSRTAHFDAIIVNTALYDKWTRAVNREHAFYVTYTSLLKYVAQHASDTTEVLIDDRSDAYALQHEAMEIIGNRMLTGLARQGRLKSVVKAKSDTTPGIQVADVLTGLFVAGHTSFLRPNSPLNSGKKLAIARAASMLGWDNLCHDTMPGSRINVWHFPIQYRNVPKTLPVHIDSPVPYVTRDDIRRP